ncbi:class I SAM-dependent methyltransferase [bacterium]|nr:class I SAM-dependent methyltransferase [bacterium]
MHLGTRNNLRRPSVGVVERALQKIEAHIAAADEEQLERLIPESQYAPLQRLRSIGRIIDHCELPATGSLVLDVGTGFGYGAVLLGSLGYKVVGIDSNEDRVRRGIALWNAVGLPVGESAQPSLSKDGSVILIHSSVADIEAEAVEKVDAATCFFLSGYMLKGDGALHQVAKHLKQGAPFFASTEGDISLSISERDGSVQALARRYQDGEISLMGLDFREYFKIREEAVYDPHLFRFSRAV